MIRFKIFWNMQRNQTFFTLQSSFVSYTIFYAHVAALCKMFLFISRRYVFRRMCPMFCLQPSWPLILRWSGACRTIRKRQIVQYIFCDIQSCCSNYFKKNSTLFLFYTRDLKSAITKKIEFSETKDILNKERCILLCP